MIPLSSLVWSLCGKGASALGIVAMLFVGTPETPTPGTSSPGSASLDAPLAELALIPEILLSPEPGHLPRIGERPLPRTAANPMSRLGMRRFAATLELGLTFGDVEGMELPGMAEAEDAWIERTAPPEKEVDSISVGLSWEF